MRAHVRASESDSRIGFVVLGLNFNARRGLLCAAALSVNRQTAATIEIAVAVA
jgi:hypothetical protein